MNSTNHIKEYFNGVNSVVLLAGLVGDPISKKYPEIGKEINLNGVLNVIDICKEKKVHLTLEYTIAQQHLYCDIEKFGIIINISQNGITPKLVHRYIFSNVK